MVNRSMPEEVNFKIIRESGKDQTMNFQAKLIVNG